MHREKKEKQGGEKVKRGRRIQLNPNAYYVSPQYQTCSKSREKYHNSCNSQEKEKKTQNKIFLSF